MVSKSIPFHPSGPPSAPPETWAPARRLALRVVRPLSHFMHIQAASGIILLLAAAAALFWANSPWAASYDHFWHTPIGVSLGGFAFSKPLHFWINDGLMVLFFFVAGLEIRRELHEGELSEIRRAALPAVAAIGGMVAPALIYLAMTHGTSVQGAWGVPMATDIAFAVGILALLGKRVPAGLRVLLLALAIIDDIGAIIVIAVCFSNDFAPSGLLVAAAGVAAIFAMQRLGIRRALAYVAPGLVVWAGTLQAGVHPTVAGVIVGLLTPVKPWYGEQGFASTTRRAMDDFARRFKEHADPHELAVPLSRIEAAQREALPPVTRLITALHPWVAFGIMPVFALANAGVNVGAVDFGYPSASIVALGVTLGLVVGKPLGVFLACRLSVSLRLCELPRGVTWGGIGIVGATAGIGFTMAIFIAGLAFQEVGHLNVSKLAILCASGAAGLLALVGGRLLLPKEAPPDIAAITVDEAEAATEY